MKTIGDINWTGRSIRWEEKVVCIRAGQKLWLDGAATTSVHSLKDDADGKFRMNSRLHDPEGRPERCSTIAQGQKKCA